MIYLLFDNLNDAMSANNTISENMGLTGDITLSWCEPIPVNNNKWAVICPDEQYLNGISNYSQADKIEVYSEN